MTRGYGSDDAVQGTEREDLGTPEPRTRSEDPDGRRPYAVLRLAEAPVKAGSPGDTRAVEAGRPEPHRPSAEDLASARLRSSHARAGVLALALHPGPNVRLEPLIERLVQGLAPSVPTRVAPDGQVPAGGVLLIPAGDLVETATPADLGQAARIAVLDLGRGIGPALLRSEALSDAALVILSGEGDVQAMRESLAQVCPGAACIHLPEPDGEGMEVWLDWLRAMHWALEQRRDGID